MEQLIRDIKAYAEARGMTPQRMLRISINAKWDQWDRWQSGGSCTVRTMEKVRKFMREHPVEESTS